MPLTTSEMFEQFEYVQATEALDELLVRKAQQEALDEIERMRVYIDSVKLQIMAYTQAGTRVGSSFRSFMRHFNGGS